ncbi:hypothetical protein B0T16DRAFT_119687 [Cercophora newfieldiana]|uniref:Uncharacterized protein n=1 Tax=Cercophora newfieldiana TaxID=92897 RepID=A0AA39Y9Z2_9PEZI|nr:hypothetical protein B0T16DRAFT_119687 [Cercophora newfieldiana]
MCLVRSNASTAKDNWAGPWWFLPNSDGGPGLSFLRHGVLCCWLSKERARQCLPWRPKHLRNSCAIQSLNSHRHGRIGSSPCSPGRYPLISICPQPPSLPDPAIVAVSDHGRDQLRDRYHQRLEASRDTGMLREGHGSSSPRGRRGFTSQPAASFPSSSRIAHHHEFLLRAALWCLSQAGRQARSTDRLTEIRREQKMHLSSHPLTFLLPSGIPRGVLLCSRVGEDHTSALCDGVSWLQAEAALTAFGFLSARILVPGPLYPGHLRLAEAGWVATVFMLPGSRWAFFALGFMGVPEYPVSSGPLAGCAMALLHAVFSTPPSCLKPIPSCIGRRADYCAAALVGPDWRREWKAICAVPSPVSAALVEREPLSVVRPLICRGIGSVGQPSLSGASLESSWPVGRQEIWPFGDIKF